MRTHTPPDEAAPAQTPSESRIGLFLTGGRFPAAEPGGRRTNEQALADLPRYAMAAEQAGFDEVFVAEHHFMPYGTCPSAVTLAAALLGATRRIGVGTAVSVLSTTHPVALAEQAALLATLFPGRFTLGLGRGGPWVDLEVFGTGIEAYERDFPESLELLLSWLGSGTGAHPRFERAVCAEGRPGQLGWAGERYRFRPVEVVPRPDRPPGVLLACTSPESAGLAARLGLPMLLGMHVGDAERARMVERYEAARQVNASATVTPRPPHAMAAVAHVADSTPQALAELRAAMPGWLRDGLAGYRRLDGGPHETRDPRQYTDFLCSIHAVGDPEHCVERLRGSMRRTGINRLLLFVEGVGEPGAVLRTITRLGREVLPALRT